MADGPERGDAERVLRRAVGPGSRTKKPKNPHDAPPPGLILKVRLSKNKRSANFTYVRFLIAYCQGLLAGPAGNR